MKRTASVCLALILLLAGCSSSSTTQIPSESEQVTSGVQQETQTPEPTPVVPEDNKQEQPEGTPTPEPSVTPDPTPSIEPEPTTTPEVADPTPEPTPSVEPTPEPEQTKEPEPTPEVTPTPQPEPEVTPTPEPSVEPTPTPTPTPEPTPTPDATIEINGGSTIEPTPTPEPEVTPTPSQTGVSWVEGQKHSKDDVKVGATVIKADGTKVVLTATKVGNLTILGYGQGVDPYSGVVLANGNLAGEGTASWYDNTVWVKCPITGSMYSSKEWDVIENATFPGRGVTGSYEGEVRNTYWKWSTEMGQWLWIGPYFAN